MRPRTIDSFADIDPSVGSPSQKSFRERVDGQSGRPASGIPLDPWPLRSKDDANVEVRERNGYTGDFHQPLIGPDRSEYGSTGQRSVFRWMPEILSLLLGVASMIIIVVVLYRTDGQHPPEWPLGITLNTFVAFFTSLAKVAFMLPIVEGLGQLKWMWFATTRTKPLIDFQLFDEASRGGYGSLKLLFRCKGVLACLAAIITLSGFLTSTITQQAILYPVNESESTNGTASVARATTFSLYDGNELQIPSHITAREKLSIVNGAFFVPSEKVPEVIPVCSSGECRWPVYGSLGICGAVANLTALGNETLLASLKNITSSRLDDIFNSTLDMVYSLTYTESLASVPASFPIVIGPVPSASGAFNDSITELLINDHYLAYSDELLTNVTASDLSHIKFLEIGFHWCTKSFSTEVRKGVHVTEEIGRVATTVKSSQYSLNFGWNPTIYPCYMAGTCNQTYGGVDIELAAPPGVPDGGTFTVNVWTSLIASALIFGAMYDSVLIDGLRGLVASNGGGMGQAFAASLFGDFMTFQMPTPEQQLDGVQNITQNMARSMTNLGRHAPDALPRHCLPQRDDPHPADIRVDTLVLHRDAGRSARPDALLSGGRDHEDNGDESAGAEGVVARHAQRPGQRVTEHAGRHSELAQSQGAGDSTEGPAGKGTVRRGALAGPSGKWTGSNQTIPHDLETAMLMASSPVTFPQSPPAHAAAHGKRPAPHDGHQPAKRRAKGGFVDDDSDDDDEPPAKKRMLSIDVQAPTASQDQLEEETRPNEDVAPEALASVTQDSQEIPDAQMIEESQEQEEEARYESLFNVRVPDFLTPAFDVSSSTGRTYKISTCSGRSLPIKERKQAAPLSYESMVASRSRTKEGRAKKSYYGIDIHALVDGAKEEIAAQASTATANTERATNTERPKPSTEAPDTNLRKPRKTMLWTEKYRARNFMDLVGDDMTNRHVLRWLKRWDPVVFPHAAKARPAVRRPGAKQQQQAEEEKPHRKILMLTGPPGLGKTTLAHVCARQAGYEVLEINASDDRSRDVVRGRIRTTLGTESVKTVEHRKAQPGQAPKIAKPVCVVVDEVDGVVSGSGGSGEGGFVKALIDLITTDQKNSAASTSSTTGGPRRKKKGDDFRQMRPLILICNDVYHTSLRPLRQSGLAEIIHVGKPAVDAVVNRLKGVFEKEGIPCEREAARKLCEAAWGMATGLEVKKGLQNTAEGDLRGVMVVGEWVAGRLRATSPNGTPQLTRQWIEKNIMHDLAHGGGGARGLGRGGSKEIVTRVFQEGAGFPRQSAATNVSKKTKHEQPQAQLGFTEHVKKYAMDRLREMVDTSGEVDRIMTEIFLEYPNREFNDDCYLSKPNMAYEWMHFHDTCTHRIYSNQEWELGQYFSQPVLACHHLFASPHRHVPTAGYDKKWGAEAEDENAAPPMPFTGARADFEAREAEKHNRAMLQTIQAQLSPTLSRSFRSPEHVATDLIPYLLRLVSPDVKPVVVGGSDKGASVASVRREGEKAMVKRAAEVLADVGIALQRGKIEEANPSVVSRTQWVYRMDPDLDVLCAYETAGAYVLASQAPTRYAVRQVLDQELQKTLAARETAARQARFKAGNTLGIHEDDFHFDDKENKGGAKEAEAKLSAAAAAASVKRDFFGRVIAEPARPLQDVNGNAGHKKNRSVDHGAGLKQEERKVWVTFHEGLNNAVKKPISLEDFLRGF
ncbi:uncharacterized protein E0L32_007339 [Thyridium curvatum]|uniref:AAA+ ATPase domain-containing protein n=1 Tax=Thyridium curvatum TaxID=1093900 RepID=A0A507AZ18_9PEZI|nr:uncharacterized protein E0L32_007339 [Thyridium curvatum]TPX12036.1 hypothetical protein E0L32_007339 [Thyridium curvatum]